MGAGDVSFDGDVAEFNARASRVTLETVFARDGGLDCAGERETCLAGR